MTMTSELPIRQQLVRMLYGDPAAGDDPQVLRQRVDALAHLVTRLLMEVEALRRTRLDEAAARGLAGKNTAYGGAYRAVAELTHNAAGPTSGIEKLLELFAERLLPASECDEVSMLRRLGYSEGEIQRYRACVDHLSQLS